MSIYQDASRIPLCHDHRTLTVCPLNQSIVNPLTGTTCHVAQTLNNCLGAHIGHQLITIISDGEILGLMRGENEGQDVRCRCHTFVCVINLSDTI